MDSCRWCHPIRRAAVPGTTDRQLYRVRNRVERLFRRLKAWRRVFTRYDKLDVMFAAFITVRSSQSRFDSVNRP